MRALVFAYSDIGVEALQTLSDLGQTIVGVVTHEDNPNEVRWFRSVSEEARRCGIPSIKPDNPNTPDILRWAKDLEPDIVFSFYYRLMLKDPLLRLAPRGAFNLHGSLLPKFRGRACVNWAVLEGATETGVTLHEMVVRADAGDIIDQEAVSIGTEETARQVFEKLVPAARRLLTRAVPLLESGKAPRIKQDEAQATYFGARKPEDGLLDWHWPAQRIHNMVRALTRPYPGAFAFLDGKKLFIWKGHAEEKQVAQEAPGQILRSHANGVPVVTGHGVYVVQEVGWHFDEVQPADAVLTTGKILSSTAVIASRNP